MAQRKTNTPTRKPRADAERNREHLLAAARPIFESKGASASLEEIARAAGFGIGTLYRHFPTRDALIEAVYRHEREQLAAAASRLAATLGPFDALREWMFIFVDYLGAKRGLSAALGSPSGGAAQLFATSPELISGAVLLLAERAQAHGDVRLTVAPMDLLAALAGVAQFAQSGSGSDWKVRARQFVEVLLAGIRTERATAEPPRVRRKTKPR